MYLLICLGTLSEPWKWEPLFLGAQDSSRDGVYLNNEVTISAKIKNQISQDDIIK